MAEAIPASAAMTSISSAPKYLCCHWERQTGAGVLRMRMRARTRTRARTHMQVDENCAQAECCWVLVLRLGSSADSLAWCHLY